MKIHIFSLSSWDEPHRLRQQLASLLSKKYSVHYHAPCPVPRDSFTPNIIFSRFKFIKNYSSLPLVSFINAIYLFYYFNLTIKPGDVVFNFLPETAFVPRRRSVKLISVINDDFASMAPKISAWWMSWMLKKMASKSDAVLYVSTRLIKKYKASAPLLFYPWSDKVSNIGYSDDRNTILYWGYISIALDYDLIESFAQQIIASSLKLKILLVGPIDTSVAARVSKILNDYSCVSYNTPRSLDEIEMSKVLFGIETISQKFHNSVNLEFPNKAPRLLSYDVPLVYSGCALLDKEFFIEYQGNLAETELHIRNNNDSIKKSIQRYFAENNSESRLAAIEKLFLDGNYNSAPC